MGPTAPFQTCRIETFAMADAPQTRPVRDVIPLYPERIAVPPRLRFPAVAALRDLRVPAELAVLARANAGDAFRFFAPAFLLAAGAALLAVLAGSVAAALGVPSVSTGAVALAAGRWTLLATSGAALAWRGVRLAAARWR